jgi:hypothetical protein
MQHVTHRTISLRTACRLERESATRDTTHNFAATVLASLQNLDAEKAAIALEKATLDDEVCVCVCACV